MSKARYFLWLAAALVGGILLGAWFNAAVSWLWGATAFFLILSLAERNGDRKALWLMLAVGLLGWGRMEIAERQMPVVDELQVWEHRELTLSGQVVSAPERNDARQKLVVKIAEPQDFPAGKVLVYASLYRDFKVGDEVHLTGKLKAPPQFEDFEYRAYLNRKDIIFLSYFPKIEIVGSGENGLGARVQAFREHSRDLMAKILPEPHAGILSATLLGFNDAADAATLEKYNRTGTRHIIAVSGSHMAIVLGALLFMLLEVGHWNRRRAMLGAAAGIGLFLAVSGLAPSAVRSGVMTSVMLIGMMVERPYSSLGALFLAASIMLFVEPRLLFDIGFQMSFLAVAGMIFVYPRLEARARSIPSLGGIKTIFLLTLAAQIFLLPLLIFNFNGFSFWSFPANLLILPVTPIIMLAGFALLLTAWVSVPLAKLLALPLYGLLIYQDALVSFFASLPGGIIKL